MCSGRQERGGGEVGYSGGVQEALLVKKKNVGGERKRGGKGWERGGCRGWIIGKNGSRIAGENAVKIFSPLLKICESSEVEVRK